jgi:hypothetical protein
MTLSDAFRTPGAHRAVEAESTRSFHSESKGERHGHG